MTITPHDQQFLREILDYLPKLGELWWKKRLSSSFSPANRVKGPWADPQARVAAMWNHKFAGKRAFIEIHDKDGRHRGTIDGRKYYAAPIIWTWMTGVWPNGEIDHRNGNPADDRWENLRLVSRSQQMQNATKPQRDLPRGVYQAKRQLSFYATIRANGEQRYLGSFRTPEEAHAAYLKAAAELHGEHAFHRSRPA